MISKADEQQDRILLFIPAYNCAPQIPRVLEQLRGLPAATFAEVLVVDNHSKDGTREAAIAAAQTLRAPRIQVVQNSDNYGLGGSHKSAFAYAAANGFTHVAVLHGDDQGKVSDLLPVLEAGLHRRFDACLGSRFMKGARLKNYSAFRVFGNHVFNALFTVTSGRRITDLGSGLNIFGRRVFEDPGVLRYSDDLRFNCYLLLGLVSGNKTFRFFPIQWSEEDQISNVKMFSQSMRTLGILWQYLTSRNSFRTRDHRDHPRDQYTFRLLGANDDAASGVEI
jgi:glycosyltransferase involved in cell wall biosynthesis